MLLMEEILHHLKCRKLCKWWDRLPINWRRISSINSIKGDFFVGNRLWPAVWPGTTKNAASCMTYQLGEYKYYHCFTRTPKKIERICVLFLKTNISPEKWWLEDDPVLLKWRRSFIFGAVILRNISAKFGGLVKYTLLKLTYKVGPKTSYE